jgi:hypothetical protein
VNSITERNNRSRSVSAAFDPTEINVYFQSIISDPQYAASEPVEIPDGTRVPLLSINTTLHLLQNLKRTASGPDDLPYWFWKEFALELAPTITNIFNTSLKLSKVP